MIADNVVQLHKRIVDAANRVGRDPTEVRIVAAAKTQSLDNVRQAVAAGIPIIGHNYVQEAAAHAAELGQDIELHMIGRLQKNKAGKAVDLFHVIQTLDSRELADAINRRASATGREIGVMIQVNLGREPQKSGIPEDDTEALARHVRGLPHLLLKGLMTMPPFFDDPERARPYFVALRQLRDRLIAKGALTEGIDELSMGMTGDFEAAVEEGATLVRIGTALFGERITGP
jgi:hypothetical protein